MTEAHDRETHRQAAAIPFRRGDSGVEVLLVTSSNSGRWILPKGFIDPGQTAAQAAETEALEEAGVIGTVSETHVATYEYSKGAATLRVQVFPLRVDRVLEEWPESVLRSRRWASLDEAMRLVNPRQLRSVLERFAASPAVEE